jgi:glycosyltransferase involved in cell wall biosynthesis
MTRLSLPADQARQILFVDHTPFAGGGQLVLAEHIAELNKQQFSPHIACTNTVPELVDRYRQAGAVVHIIDMPRLRGISYRVPWQLWRTVRQLRQLIRSQHIALVVANTTRASYFVTLALWGTRVPSIWWVRDFLYPRRLFKWLRSKPKKVIYVSKAVRDFYVSAEDPQAVVLYVASNLYKQLAAITSQHIASQLGIYDLTGHQVIGFMGRLVAEKGPEDVVAAMMMLTKEYPNVRLLLVGTGKNQQHDVETSLHQLVKQQRLEQVVLFAGYQADEALYYSLFDIFVLATRDGEPFATSVVQALMAGAAVVGTNIGGTPELIEDGHTGLLYSPGNVVALAKAIRKLLDQPQLMASLARDGQKRVLQYHREEQLARQAEAVYLDVLT